MIYYRASRNDLELANLKKNFEIRIIPLYCIIKTNKSPRYSHKPQKKSRSTIDVVRYNLRNLAKEIDTMRQKLHFSDWFVKNHPSVKKSSAYIWCDRGIHHIHLYWSNKKLYSGKYYFALKLTIFRIEIVADRGNCWNSGMKYPE